jgi:HlyD family secretion protein
MSVRRSLILMSFLIVALPLTAFYLRANPPQAAQPRRQLQEYTVAFGDVALSVTAVGRIEPDQSVRLSFPIGGRVTALPFEAGDRVAAGDLLAEIENESQQIALAQAELALMMARMQKERLLQGADAGQIRIAQANLDAARAALASAVSAVSPADIRTLELAYQQALAAYDAAVEARANAPGDRPQAAYDLLEARIGQASFNAEIARLQLEQARAGANAGQRGALAARVRQAQAELDRLLAGPAQAEIDRADAQIAQAQTQVNQARTALERTRIIAPFDGVIASINAQVGGLALPSVPIIELVDPDPLRVTIFVDEIDIRQIRAGMDAVVRLDALPGVELPARLERIGLVGANQAGIVSYEVSVRLDGSDPRVRIGMTAEASIVVERRENVLVVPNQYIRLDRQRGRAFVNRLLADGSLSEVEVTLGLQSQDRSEILSGVSAGETLAVDLAGDSLSLFGG